ncbi:hypothetical protein F1D45_24495, partial [Klebsiella pneumoniae]
PPRFAAVEFGMVRAPPPARPGGGGGRARGGAGGGGGGGGGTPRSAPLASARSRRGMRLFRSAPPGCCLW